MKGKGIKHLHSHGTGDELVRIKVQIPERLTREQERLVKEFQKEAGKKTSFLDRIFG